MKHTTHMGTSVESADEEPCNGYLEGPFAPVAQEVTARDLDVIGKIPEELNGRFLRVGSNPNPIDPEDPRTYSWFSGTGMIFGVRLREGRAEWYRNRFVRDDQISPSLGMPRVPGPDQLARREPYRKLSGPRFVDTNVANTHVFAVAGRTYVSAEAGVLPMEISYELETVARTDFDGTLNGSWTGHPHRDPDTGDLHGIAYYWQWDHASYQVLGADGKVKKRIDVPVHGRPAIHDMAITSRYAIFLDGPMDFNEQAHAAGQGFPYVWDLEYPVRWALVPRDGEAADVKWCESDQTCVFHILNAFDLPDGKVALDAVSYPKVFISDLSGPTESKGRLERFILDPATGRTVVERLDDRPQEMPRLDDRLTGKQHRYGYFTGRRGSSAIIKHDLDKQSTEAFEHGPGKVGIETVFVPRTPDSAEDDGWLMTHVIDMPTQTSEMLILHAQDLAAGPVARIKFPHRPNTGFHGNWIPDEELERANG